LDFSAKVFSVRVFGIQPAWGFATIQRCRMGVAALDLRCVTET
jgi:hypothetical protein